MKREMLGGTMFAIVLLASVRPAVEAIVWLTGGVCEAHWTEGCDERTEAEASWDRFHDDTWFLPPNR